MYLAVGLLGQTIEGYYPGRNKMSYDEDLLRELGEVLEQGGALVSHIKLLIRSPGTVRGLISVLDGESKIVEELAAKPIPTRSWFLSLPEMVSEGCSGVEMVNRLRGDGYHVGHVAKSVMRSPDFKVSAAGVTYRPVVVDGANFSDTQRISKNVIRVATEELGLLVPPAELAALLRRLVIPTDHERLGFRWIVVMHNLINDSSGYPCRLGLAQNGNTPALNPYPGNDSREWLSNTGFVFLKKEPVLPSH